MSENPNDATRPYLLWLSDDEIRQVEGLVAVVGLLIAEQRQRFGENAQRYIRRYELIASLLQKVDRLSFQYEDPQSIFYYRQQVLMHHDSLKQLLAEYSKRHSGENAESIKVSQLLKWCENYRSGSRKPKERPETARNLMMMGG